MKPMNGRAKVVGQPVAYIIPDCHVECLCVLHTLLSSSLGPCHNLFGFHLRCFGYASVDVSVSGLHTSRRLKGALGMLF